MTSSTGARAKIKPLGLILAIVRDTRFTHAEVRFLTSAIGHTDNATGKHRNTLRLTAEEVGVGKNVSGSAIKKASAFGYIERVHRYRNDSGNQMVDVWFATSLASISIPGPETGIGPIPEPVPGPVPVPIPKPGPETGTTSATSTSSTTSASSALGRRALVKASDLDLSGDEDEAAPAWSPDQTPRRSYVAKHDERVADQTARDDVRVIDGFRGRRTYVRESD